jgi:hypothetical protein
LVSFVFEWVGANCSRVRKERNIYKADGNWCNQTAASPSLCFRNSMYNYQYFKSIWKRLAAALAESALSAIGCEYIVSYAKPGSSN